MPWLAPQEHKSADNFGQFMQALQERRAQALAPVTQQLEEQKLKQGAANLHKTLSDEAFKTEVEKASSDFISELGTLNPSDPNTYNQISASLARHPMAIHNPASVKVLDNAMLTGERYHQVQDLLRSKANLQQESEAAKATLAANMLSSKEDIAKLNAANKLAVVQAHIDAHIIGMNPIDKITFDRKTSIIRSAAVQKQITPEEAARQIDELGNEYRSSKKAIDAGANPEQVSLKNNLKSIDKQIYDKKLEILRAPPAYGVVDTRANAISKLQADRQVILNKIVPDAAPAAAAPSTPASGELLYDPTNRSVAPIQ